MRPLVKVACAVCGLVLALGLALVTLDYIDELNRRIEDLVAAARTEGAAAAVAQDPGETRRDAEAGERAAAAALAEKAQVEERLNAAVASRDRAVADGEERVRARLGDIEVLRRTNDDLRGSLATQSRKLAALEQSLARAETAEAAAAETQPPPASPPPASPPPAPPPPAPPPLASPSPVPPPPDRQEEIDDLRRRLADLQTASAALEERFVRASADADALRVRAQDLSDLAADAARIDALDGAIARLPAIARAPAFDPSDLRQPGPAPGPKAPGDEAVPLRTPRTAAPVPRPAWSPRRVAEPAIPIPPPIREERPTRTAQRPFTLPPELRPIGR